MSRPDPICPRCGYSLVGEVFATRRYLRMRHALGVAVATTVLATLLAFTAVFLVFSDSMERLLFW